MEPSWPIAQGVAQALLGELEALPLSAKRLKEALHRLIDALIAKELSELSDGLSVALSALSDRDEPD